MNLGENLKKIRKENNLSQEQLAESLGVSRQSVSKWESGLAYPETDKVLALCKMFNLNMDELMNQDYKDVNETRQKNSNINKYVDDFLGYVTKTVDMFGAMKLKSKIKCLFELAFIIFVIYIICCIIGSVASGIVFDVLSFLPGKVSHFLYDIVKDVYVIASFVLGTILVFHIFKTRYLDYYSIAVNDIKEETEAEEDNIDDKKENKKKTIVLDDKRERIVIRDPDHSSYKFIKGLAKFFLIFIKIFAVCIALGFCFNLIGFATVLTFIFMFLKTGLMFIGALLITLSCIAVNIIILDILYHFIISTKSKKKLLFITFIISLIVLGIGSGICAIAATEFDIVEDPVVKEEKVISMKDNLIIEDSYGFSFIESNSNDVKIVTKHSKYYKPVIEIHDNHVSIYYNSKDKMDMIRNVIKEINNKHISNGYTFTTEIHTSKDNIKKLKHNINKYYDYDYYE